MILEEQETIIQALKQQLEREDISSLERTICEELLEELTQNTEKVTISQTVFLGDNVFNHQEVKVNKKLLKRYKPCVL